MDGTGSVETEVTVSCLIVGIELIIDGVTDATEADAPITRKLDAKEFITLTTLASVTIICWPLCGRITVLSVSLDAVWLEHIGDCMDDAEGRVLALIAAIGTAPINVALLICWDAGVGGGVIGATALA